MRAAILKLFPPYLHPLTLVSDPANLLEGELRHELEELGFTIYHCIDPLATRGFVETRKPFSATRPLLICSGAALNTFPYDLYDQGHKIDLDPALFMPAIAYPVLRGLTADLLFELYNYPRAREFAPLGLAESLRSVCSYLFQADLDRVRDRVTLLRWLSDHYQRSGPMPEPLYEYWKDTCRSAAFMDATQLDQAFTSKKAFSDLLDHAWGAVVNAKSSQASEPAHTYGTSFLTEREWGEVLPALVRDCSLVPLHIRPGTVIEPWMSPGVQKPDDPAAAKGRLHAELEQLVGSSTPSQIANWGWDEWKNYANDLSKIKAQAAMLDMDLPAAGLADVEREFVQYAKSLYIHSATQKLPSPHHVFHVPHYLAYLHEKREIDKFILLVLDGFSLVDWHIAKEFWLPRRSWRVAESCLLAQIPTITSVSRMAMVSGDPPALFSPNDRGFPGESKAWQRFWLAKGISPSAVGSLSLQLDKGTSHHELTDPQKQIWYMVDDTTDKFSHDAVYGENYQRNNLLTWLRGSGNDSSLPLEELIDQMLNNGFTIFLTSDHGHTEAIGQGIPSEGTLASTRGKRARVYNDKTIAQRSMDAFPGAMLWGDDGLLPSDYWALMPGLAHSFDAFDQRSLTHGGISLEELIIPFIKIDKEP